MRDTSMSLVRAEVANVTARAIVTAIDTAMMAGRPFTNLQMIDLIAAAMVEYDGTGTTLEELGRLDSALARIAGARIFERPADGGDQRSQGRPDPERRSRAS